MPRMRPRDGPTAAWAAQPAPQQSAGQIVRTAVGAPLRMSYPRSTHWRAPETFSPSIGAQRQALRSVARRLMLRHMPSGRTIDTMHETERQVRLFRNSRSQTQRIPREFELAADGATLRFEGDTSLPLGHQHPVRPDTTFAGSSRTADRLERRDSVCTITIVACELRHGAEKKIEPLSERVNLVLSALEVLPLETLSDFHYGEIRHHLAPHGNPVGPNDLVIAAHARAFDLTVVIDNEREFSRVPDLQVENWLSDRRTAIGAAVNSTTCPTVHRSLQGVRRRSSNGWRRGCPQQMT